MRENVDGKCKIKKKNMIALDSCLGGIFPQVWVLLR